MPLTALRAATTICGGLALGDVHARMAGRAREAWTDGRKGGPPANEVVSHVSISCLSGGGSSKAAGGGPAEVDVTDLGKHTLGEACDDLQGLQPYVVFV